jgi:hypothetical protein
MKDFKVLNFLDMFKCFFEKLGIDYTIMRKILQMKFIMDGRRVPTIMKSSGKNETTESNFTNGLWFYLLI